MFKLCITGDLGFEVWQDIPGYEGRYQASTDGRIRSMSYISYHGGVVPKRMHKGKILKPSIYNKHYLRVDIKKKHFPIHRLVAKTFIPNFHNYPFINHKDENPSNNRVENLEWCTPDYNNNYGTRNKKVAEKLVGRKVSAITKEKLRISHLGKKPTNSCPVKQIGNNNEILKEYSSISSAALSIGVSSAAIRKVLNKDKKKCKGFFFKTA